MININTIKAGHIATVLMQGEYKLNKGGRSGLPINKYSGRVTRDFRFTISLAGEETYNNIYPDSVGKPNWFSFVKDGVVTHNKNGGLYLAGIPHNNKRNRFDLLVDGSVDDWAAFMDAAAAALGLGYVAILGSFIE